MNLLSTFVYWLTISLWSIVLRGVVFVCALANSQGHLQEKWPFSRDAAPAMTAALLLCASLAVGSTHAIAATTGVAVGAQYDSTHVYVAAGDLDAFVRAFTATFGGSVSARVTANVTPTPSSTQFQYLWTPVGTLSAFAFLTPIPYPFGQERTGWLVTEMDPALAAARRAGAEVIVGKFKDAIGYDAVIQWPGGVKMQLYWHFTAPSYAPLATIPESRIYLSADTVDAFVRGFLKFSRGTLTADDKTAAGGEIGKPGESYRRLRIESGFGKLQIMVTDGHLPYPFGHDVTGYEVKDFNGTLKKAKGAGVKVLSPPFDGPGRVSTIVEFPGGYIAEIHASAG